MQSVTKILLTIGAKGVQAIKNDIEKVSATGESKSKVRLEVKSTDDYDKLIIYGPSYIETGRGPRKGTTYEGFDNRMLEYMKARGIGADLPEKKRMQLAKFLAFKINKEGDKTFKQGGRIVYTPSINKLVEELKTALKKDRVQFLINEIRKGVTTDKKAA